jgi:hypothetical protein
MELREGANVNWADATVRYVRMDYDQIVVGLRPDDGTDRTVEITANGPIGFQWSGLWDETIVESALLTSDHEFARQSWAAIVARGDDRSDSGSPARNRRSWLTLDVTFSDGSHLLVAGAVFEVAQPDLPS